MPYIDKQRRRMIDQGLNLNTTPGDLTYQMQQLLQNYLEGNGLSYARLAECLGALEGAKLDFIERVVKPYEQQKLQKNGDVWPAELTESVAAVTTYGHHPHLEDELETYTFGEVQAKLLNGDITTNEARQLGSEGRIHGPKLCSTGLGWPTPPDNLIGGGDVEDRSDLLGLRESLPLTQKQRNALRRPAPDAYQV